VTLYTIGHSTHSAADFLQILKSYDIHLLVDVRTIPKSRYNPQFASEALSATLTQAGIEYRHMPGLGGLRHARKDSINTAWKNDSFRGYADYMQTAEFATHLEELIAAARLQRTCIMCAEAVPWRCHRSLIGDALLARGIVAEDILSATQMKPHTLTKFARVHGLEVTYPPDTLPLGFEA